MISSRLLPLAAASLAALAGPSAAAVPNADYTDMWWNPSQSGWGVSFMQHGANGQAYATWYTYDPRTRDNATGRNVPLWVVMTGGTWTAPNTITGRAYVFNGVPYNQSGTNPRGNDVGTFTLTFSDYSNATFTYDIAAPANVASNDPAYGLPAMSGSVAISRFPY